MVEIWDAASRRWGRCGTDADGPLLVRRHEAGAAGRRRTSTATSSRAGCSAPADAVYFPTRRGERADPVLSRSTTDRATLVADGGRRAALRHPPAGRAADGVLCRLTALFVPDALREARRPTTRGCAAMLDAERALARRAARAGSSRPTDEAFARRTGLDVERARARGPRRRQPGRAARARAARAVADARAPRRDEPGHPRHRGDARRARRDGARRRASSTASPRACARLADEHRATRRWPARTLLQQAVPTTFGLKAAGWLVGVARRARAPRRAAPAGAARRRGGDARGARRRRARRAARLRRGARAAGAGRCRGTRAGCRSPSSARALAGRGRLCAKIALDVVAARADRGRRGARAGERRLVDDAAQAQPGRRRARARVRRARARGRRRAARRCEHEHERAAGAWHAEWKALSDALALTGGAAACAARDARRASRSTPSGCARTCERETLSRGGALRTRRARARGLPRRGGRVRRPRARVPVLARVRHRSSSPARSARRSEMWDAQVAGARAASRRPLRPPGARRRAAGRRARRRATSRGRRARRARGRALLVLRPLARRRRRHVARARRAGARSTGSCSLHVARASAPPERWHERDRARRARGGMEAIADAVAATLVHAARSATCNASARCSSSTPPEGYARCCEALRELRPARRARRHRARRRS